MVGVRAWELCLVSLGGFESLENAAEGLSSSWCDPHSLCPQFCCALPLCGYQSADPARSKRRSRQRPEKIAAMII